MTAQAAVRSKTDRGRVDVATCHAVDAAAITAGAADHMKCNVFYY